MLRILIIFYFIFINYPVAFAQRNNELDSVEKIWILESRIKEENLIMQL
jgi:hypothetical protein